jgi:hypothetical protein
LFVGLLINYSFFFFSHSIPKLPYIKDRNEKI